MTYASLFTGAGGADIGLHRAGFTPLWFAEIDKFASSVLAHHFSDIPNHGDITKLDPAKLEAPFLLWMSPPCQDLSVAGKRKGLSGERSGLFFDAIRIAANLVRRGTRIIAMEQVPGLLSSHGGNDFRAVLSAFLEIGARDVAWAVLDAQWFGVAQRRERAFFVADFGGSSASEILALAEGLCGNPSPSRGEGEIATIWVEGDSKENCIPEIARALKINSHHADRPGAMCFIPRVADTLGATSSRNNNAVNALNYVGYTVFDVAATLGTPQGGANDLARLGEVIPIKECASNQWSKGFEKGACGPGIGNDGDPTYCLGALASNMHGVAFGWNKSQSQTLKFDVKTDALQASPTSNPAAVVFQCVRRLTPRECERLQGWPDDWTRHGATGEISDTQRYKMIGNGVASPVAEWIGKQIKKYIADA